MKKAFIILLGTCLMISHGHHARSQDNRETAQVYCKKALEQIEASEFQEAHDSLYKAWQLDKSNGDYRWRYMYLAVYMGQQALFSGNHDKALELFTTAFELKKAMSKNEDVEFVTIKRFIELTEDHKKLSPINPDYVYKIKVLYIMNTDLKNSFDNNNNPAILKGTIPKNLMGNNKRNHEMLRIYVETLSKGRLSLSFDTEKINATLTRVTPHGQAGENTVFQPDFDSVQPSLTPLFYKGRNTYDSTLLYWYSGKLYFWPWTSWGEGGVPIVPYTWRSSAMRSNILFGSGEEAPQWNYISNIAHHFVWLHEFFHITEYMSGNIAPQHAHLPEEFPKARVNSPAWVPDMNKSWTATEYSWYKYHYLNTLPKRTEELAGQTGLSPAWRYFSYVNRFPDTTDEALYKKYTSAIKGITLSDLQKASDLHSAGQKAYWAGKKDKAMDFQKQALQHNPYHIGALDSLGWLAIELKNNDFVMAEKYYNTVIRVFPHPKNCFLYGLVFYERNQAARAVPYFRIPAERPDAKPVYVWWAAKALAAAGDSEGAETMMKRIMKHPVINSPLAFINCKAADVALQSGSNPEDEGNFWLWKLYRQSSSRWRLVPVGDGVHVRIVSEYHWRCLEARGTKDKAGIGIAPARKSDSQKWILSKGNNGEWGIVSKTLKRSLTVVPAAAGMQPKLALLPTSGDPLQKWDIEIHDPAVGAMDTLPTAAIISSTGLAMDVAGGNMADGTPICQWNWGKDNWNQKWKLVLSQIPGHVLLISARTLKCVTAVDNEGYARPIQQTVKQTDAQLWKLVEKSAGQYQIINRQNGMALQPDPWKQNDLVLGPAEDSPKQLWKIEY